MESAKSTGEENKFQDEAVQLGRVICVGEWFKVCIIGLKLWVRWVRIFALYFTLNRCLEYEKRKYLP